MIRTKKDSKKNITTTITLLGATALVATGFATWVIISGDTKETTGQVTVDAVENRARTITLGYWDDDKDSGSFIFAAKEGATLPSWLKVENTNGFEKLDSKLEFSVANAKGVENKDLFQTISFVEDDTTTFGKAIESTYFADLPTTYVDSEPTDNNNNISYMLLKRQDNRDGSSVDFTLTIHLNWGTAFDNKNPAEYANELENPSDEAKDEVSKKLSEAYAANNAKFKLTIATKA